MIFKSPAKRKLELMTAEVKILFREMELELIKKLETATAEEEVVLRGNHLKEVYRLRNLPTKEMVKLLEQRSRDRELGLR